MTTAPIIHIHIHAAFPPDSAVHGWLAAAANPTTADPSRAGVVLFSPEAADALDAAARAGRGGARAVACLPVSRPDGWFVADGAARHAGVRADAYASDAPMLLAALRFVTEERRERTRGPLRLTWLGALGELFPDAPPIGRAFPISRVGLRLGRTDDNDVVLRQGPHSDQCSVARRHALFEAIDAGVRVRDLDSTNGVYVGGARVAEAVLRPGDEVAVCGTLRLRVDGAG